MEVLIVVVILGILAAIVIPQFAGASRSAEQIAFIADMRIYNESTLEYTGSTGQLLAGTLPAGGEPYVNETNWISSTPIGGVWDFGRD